MTELKRNHFIDMAKGLTIFLMLWGHCIQYCIAQSGLDFFENAVFKTIYSFHMPLFMLISGYLFFYSFSKRNLTDLLVHRTQSLLQPIVFCTFFNYLVTTALFHIISGEFDFGFNGSWMQELPSLWFLWSVLAASTAMAIICKKCKNLFVQILLLLAFIPLIAILPNMHLNLYMYPYFILGFYFAKYKEKLPPIVHRLKYFSLPIFPILMCFFEKKHYIYTTGLLFTKDGLVEMLAIDAYRWLIGLVGSVFVLTVLEIVYNHLLVRLPQPTIVNAVSALGKKSMQIYAFSVPFLSVYLSKFFPKMLSLLKIENIFTQNIIVYNFVFTLLLAVAYAIALHFMIKLFDRMKITKIMFGK